jgi:hypothetical protein
MADPAVSIERRRRDPAFLAALVALGLAVLALTMASHDILATSDSRGSRRGRRGGGSRRWPPWRSSGWS